MILTKQETQIAKGVAICLIFIHHLFAFKGRMVDGNTYIPLFLHYDVELYIGKFGRLSVAIFLFLSGFGFLKSLERNPSALKAIFFKVVRFYRVYWSYLLIFVPIGFLFFNQVKIFNSNNPRYAIDTLIFLKNFFGLSSSYNPEWWFVNLYLAILVLLLPLFKLIIDRSDIVLVLLSIALYGLSLRIHVFSNLFFWQLSFAVGMIVSKHENKFEEICGKLFSLNIFYILSFMVGIFIFRFRFNKCDADFLIAPLFVFVSISLSRRIRTDKVLELLGKYSFQMWLVHSFYCYYFFQSFIYAPKYSPLIFGLLTLCSLSTAMLVENSKKIGFNMASRVMTPIIRFPGFAAARRRTAR